MGLEAKLVQKLSQQLLMTPQLQQAIKLLQLGRLEYLEAIEKEVMENPVLELLNEDDAPKHDTNVSESTPAYDGGSEGNGSDSESGQPGADSSQLTSDRSQQTTENGTPAGDEPTQDWSEYMESIAEYRGLSSTPKGMVDFEERPSLENTLTRGENLAEHVLFQLRMMEISKEEQEIALQVVGNLNKDGYLCASYEEIAEDARCEVGKVEELVEKIKYLDPPGVGSRTLGECLFVQLEQAGLSDGLAGKIVLNHLDKLERRAYEKIAKTEQVAVEEVYKAVRAIQTLEPKPGRPFGEEAPSYITPDIYVYKVGEDWVITLNEDGLPKLRISPYYLDLLKQEEGSGANKEYINERLKAATWLIKSIHQRQRTIYRVTESILKFQKEFFELGIERLKPMVLKDVADDIGMHESTVSRVTTNKYVHTPHGVFELKFFFTSAIKASGGGEVSSSSVKERIRTIIAAEAPGQPISDQEIVDILKKENVEIARRTVAKYREALGILSSSKRKNIL